MGCLGPTARPCHRQVTIKSACLAQPSTDTKQNSRCTLADRSVSCTAARCYTCIGVPLLAANPGESRQTGRTDRQTEQSQTCLPWEISYSSGSACVCTQAHAWFLQPWPFPRKKFQKSVSWVCSGLTLLISKRSTAVWGRVFKRLPYEVNEQSSQSPQTPNLKGRM